jgi:hypothetical protein
MQIVQSLPKDHSQQGVKLVDAILVQAGPLAHHGLEKTLEKLANPFFTGAFMNQPSEGSNELLLYWHFV